MDYKETLDFLYNQLPVFQKQGVSAYKPGLETTRMLCQAFGTPHNRFACIHVAGTNGKGSTAHTLAAVLQSAGFKVGLFTSPHLIDFRERIRVDGEMIPEKNVVEFVSRFKSMGLDCEPSFFELTTIMAFDFFAECNVDVAVIEVGLGGRLDSTNIITPELSVITNISLDHTSLLGRTDVDIAYEKAGIIKYKVPVVIGEAGSPDVKSVFVSKALKEDAPIYFAEDIMSEMSYVHNVDSIKYTSKAFGEIKGELSGEYQVKNTRTILSSLQVLREIGYEIPVESVKYGFANVCRLTGLTGRWMKLSSDPTVLCDTGHNPGGWQYITKQLNSYSGKKHLVIGFVSDKDVSEILRFAAKIDNAVFYFTKPDIKRALPIENLTEIAHEIGIDGLCFESVDAAYKEALAECGKGDTVFVGGSNFIVADLMRALIS